MTDTGFTIPPKLYDFLKWIALAVLPAAAALVITIGSLLHWEPATVTAGVVTAVDTFLGLLLGKSSANFKTQTPETIGDLVFGTDQDGATYTKRLSISKDNPVFDVGSKITLNVVHELDQQ